MLSVVRSSLFDCPEIQTSRHAALETQFGGKISKMLPRLNVV